MTGPKYIILALLSWTRVAEASLPPTSFLDLLASYGFGSYNIKTVAWPILKEYDFIVVGAGSGGSSVANRLSENPNWRVLLLEAGRTEGLLNQIPIIVSSFQQTDYNWGYRVQPQKDACLGMKDRRCTWPRGKSLGGTSTINYMIHTRGNKLDYEDWAALGNERWSWDKVLPYYAKSERFRVPGEWNASYHGTDGYLCVEYAPYHSVLAKEFLRAGEHEGWRVLDYNGPDQLGVSYLQLNMDEGARCSASKAYLRVSRENLDIVTEARVTRILINREKRAYGVEFTKKGTTDRVHARREVVLSAGTIDSAKLLMLSGIGPRDHLESLKIEVRKDAKVGYNLHEHIGFLGLTFLANRSVTLLQRRMANPEVLLSYALKRGGPMSIPGGAEALAFLRTRYASDARPDIELLFVSGSIASDNGLSVRRGHGISDRVYETVFQPLENRDAWSIWPILQRPRSQGRILLASADPRDAPLLEPNFFSHPADIEILLEGLKHAINVSRTAPFRAYGSQIHDVKIPGCETHDFATDDYWRCAIRHLPAMMNHEVGTVKMGPDSDENAVVDQELRVRGIERLRVVDASVMPLIPVGHVNAGIYMIGEKAADMIKETWE